MIAANRLRTLLNAGHFVVSAELTPPRHYKVKPLLSKAEKIAAHVDVVHLNDNTLSQARLSNVVAARLIQQMGIEPVVQLTPRHKNRIALQSDLLGLAALGISNIMVLGGYPCSIGSDPEAKEANDISAIDAIAAIHNLTTYGKMFNGDAIAPAPNFYIGTIASPYTAPDKLDESMALLEAKINRGARYIQLQATFDLAAMQQWMAEVVKRGLHQRVHFIGAVFPFSSWKGLEFLQKIPGFTIPNEVVERIRSGNCKSESLKVTLELIQGMQAIEGIRGIHLRLIGSSNCSEIVELAGLRQAQHSKTI
jgi:methylenetetrahydrofolate reductase (NADPH)